MTQIITCPNCINYLGDLTCKAFPKGIPDEILLGNEDHTKPYPGDRGFQFKIDQSNDLFQILIEKFGASIL